MVHVGVLKFQTGVACKKRPRQTAQTLEQKQSDQGLPCLLFSDPDQKQSVQGLPCLLF